MTVRARARFYLEQQIVVLFTPLIEQAKAKYNRKTNRITYLLGPMHHASHTLYRVAVYVYQLIAIQYVHERAAKHGCVHRTQTMNVLAYESNEKKSTEIQFNLTLFSTSAIICRRHQVTCVDAP